MAIQRLGNVAAATGEASPVASSRPPPASGNSSRAAAEVSATASAAQVQQAVEDVRRAVEPVARNLQFSIDEETGKTIVRVVDASTQQVIRQIPAEELLQIARALDRMQGLLLRQKA